jgi:hypothetical protein
MSAALSYNAGMSDVAADRQGLAVHCLYLKRGILSGSPEQYLAVCQHPVRAGKECIGPFLEDLTTPCRLWEAHPDAAIIPLPQPERWQGRRRHDGFDLQRPYQPW